MINSAPAPVYIYFAGSSLLTTAPKITASSEVSTSAAAEPIKTASRDLLSAAKARVDEMIRSRFFRVGV
jgi:hypothetical protein